VEYAGELISAAEGYRREDDDNSVYRFYFSHQNTTSGYYPSFNK